MYKSKWFFAQLTVLIYKWVQLYSSEWMMETYFYIYSWLTTTDMDSLYSVDINYRQWHRTLLDRWWQKACAHCMKITVTVGKDFLHYSTQSIHGMHKNRVVRGVQRDNRIWHFSHSVRIVISVSFADQYKQTTCVVCVLKILTVGTMLGFLADTYYSYITEISAGWIFWMMKSF